MSKRELCPATMAAQALAWPEPHQRGLVPPIYPSASYERAVRDVLAPRSVIDRPDANAVLRAFALLDAQVLLLPPPP